MHLHQRPRRSHETRHPRVQNGHQRHLGHVQTLPQQLRPHQHVDVPSLERLQLLRTLRGGELGVQPVRPTPADLVQVAGEVLAVRLGQRADQRRLAASRALPHSRRELRQLIGAGKDFNRRVYHPAGSHHHVHHARFAPLVLDVPRGGGHEQRLRHALPELFERERAVIQRGGQPVPASHEPELSAPVPAVHGAELREHDVRLVRDEEPTPVARAGVGPGPGSGGCVGGVEVEVVEERDGGFALGAAPEVPGVMLRARAPTQLVQQRNVRVRPLLQPLRLHPVPVRPQLRAPLAEFPANRRRRQLQSLGRRDVVLPRPQGHPLRRRRKRGRVADVLEDVRRALRAVAVRPLWGPHEPDEPALFVEVELQRRVLVRRPNHQPAELGPADTHGTPRPLPPHHPIRDDVVVRGR